MTILGTVASTSSMVVDGIIVGNFLGSDGLAAYGLAMPVFIVLIGIGTVFSNGGSVLASKYMGSYEYDKVNINFTLVLGSAILISLLLTIVSFFSSGLLAGFLGANGNLMSLTGDYIFGILLGAIPITLFQILLTYSRLDGSVSLGLYAALGVTIVNIILDIVFVSVFNMGMFGLGIATSISCLVGTLITLSHFFKKNNSLHLSSFSGVSELVDVFSIGLPTALKQLYITMRTIITNKLAIWVGGAVVMGALALQSNINQILCSIELGVGTTVLVIGGVFFGENDQDSLKYLLKIGLKYGISLILVLTAIIFVFAQNIVVLFGNNPQIYDTAIWSLKLFSLSLLPSLLCLLFLNFYNSINNLFMANYISLAHGFLSISLVAIILTPIIGANGIWLAFVLGETITLCSIFLVIKIKYGKFPKSLDDLLLLDEGHIDDSIANLHLSLENNMDDVMELSAKVNKFCEKYIDDVNKINKLSLCIEEMAGNIIKFAFKEGSVHYIDINIKIFEDKIIFRIRDDGEIFNPLEYESTENTIGIAMIKKIATDIDYRNTVGLNNLIITL